MVPYGQYIKVFGLEHIIYITGLIIIAVLLFKFKESVKTNENTVTIFILIASICQQILLYSSYFVLMEFDLAESLPFHISRINSILGIIFLVTKNKKVYTVLCYFGLYAWTSFLYPSRVYGITHPIGISFFVNHVITLLMPYYGMIAYDIKIKKGDKNKAFFWFLIYLTFVYFFNPLVDGNYFYLKYKPIFAFLPEHVYLLCSMLFTYVLFSIGEIIYFKVQDKLNVKANLAL